MIDLTPLDVRKKRGDFAKGLRGYDPREVDHFLEMVAERLEGLVKENLSLREQVERLTERVQGQEGRENAVNEALVTAQELRKEIREQANREAELIRREARADAERVLGEVDRQLQERRRALLELNRSRERFLRSFKSMLERQLDAVEVEQESPQSAGFDLDALREAVTRDEEIPVPPRAPRREAVPAEEVLPPRTKSPDQDGTAESADRSDGTGGEVPAGEDTGEAADPATPLDSLLDKEAGGDEGREQDLFSPTEPGGESPEKQAEGPGEPSRPQEGR